MYKAEFEVKAITPIFMRGADQTKAEIRSASIKGLMRWWFRALAGNYFGNDIAELKMAEEEIFGSTKQRSRVVVEVDADKLKSKQIMAEYEITYDRRRNVLRTKAKSIKIHISNDKENNTQDLPNYLFFSIKMLVDETAKNCLKNVLSKFRIRNRFYNENQMRGILGKKGLNYPKDLENELQKEFNKNALTYYPSGTKFHVKIKAFDDKSFRIALASFWSLVTLGGIGFRSRRGAGSIKVKKILDVRPEKLREDVSKLFNHNWREIDEAAHFWDPSFKEILKELNLTGKVGRDEIFQYPSLKEVIVLEYNDYIDDPINALKILEKSYAGELKKINGKYRYVGGIRFNFADRNFSHKVIERLTSYPPVEKTTKERRFYFGLPLIYANWKVEVKGYNENKSQSEYERRASSIILTVKEDNKKYVPLVVIFPHQFLPNHQGKFVAIKKERNKKKEEISFILPVNNNDFIDWLKNDIVKVFGNKGFAKVYPKEAFK